MRLTCGDCGGEIVGAFVISGLTPDGYGFKWSSVPEVVNAHNTECFDA